MPPGTAPHLRRPATPVAIVVVVFTVLAALALAPRGSSGQTPDPTGNLVPNPTIDRARDRTPAGWERGAWGSLDARYSVARPGQAGPTDAALQIVVARHDSGDAKWMFPAVAVEPGQRYEFGFSYKANVASAAVAELTMADGRRSYIPLADLDPSSTRWVEHHSSIVVPEGAVKLTAYHQIAAVGWIRSDTFALRLAPAEAVDAAVAGANGIAAGTANPAPAVDAAPAGPQPVSGEPAPAAPAPNEPTVAPPAPPAAPPAPPAGGEPKCVVGLPGAGGSTDANYGFGGGKGYPQGPGFQTRTTPDLPELHHVQAAAEGCGSVIVHGFSEGGRRAKELYCSGETLGGRVVGYIIDDPNYFPDEGQPCTPGPGVKVAFYATRIAPGDSAWTPNVYLSHLGYGDVIAKTSARIGVAVKESPNYSHMPYTNPNPPEISGSSWW